MRQALDPCWHVAAVRIVLEGRDHLTSAGVAESSPLANAVSQWVGSFFMKAN